MERSTGMKRAVAVMIGALSKPAHAINNIFNVGIGDVYEPPIINNNCNIGNTNRLSQKGHRKRARWIR